MGVGITGFIQSLSGSSDKDLYGSKPRNAPHIDYASELQGIVQSNIELLPSLQQLGLLSTDALTAMLERALPGFTNLRDTTTGILSDKLEGKIPRDVEQLLERNAAERGVTLGTSGSQFKEFDTLRNLGLTSLAIQNEGLSQTSSWLNQNRGNTFDFSKFLLGKEDAEKQAEFNWNVDRMNELGRVAPDPRVRGSWDTEMGFVGEILSIYGGGAGYQQTYRGGSANGGGGYSGGGGGGWGGRRQGYDSYFGGGGWQGDLPEGISSGAEY